MSARRRSVGCERFELCDDLFELCACTAVVGLSEHGPDECGDGVAVIVTGGGEQVAHRVDAAALPGVGLQGPGDRDGEPSRCAGDDVIAPQAPNQSGRSTPPRLSPAVPRHESHRSTARGCHRPRSVDGRIRIGQNRAAPPLAPLVGSRLRESHGGPPPFNPAAEPSYTARRDSPQPGVEMDVSLRLASCTRAAQEISTAISGPRNCCSGQVRSTRAIASAETLSGCSVWLASTSMSSGSRVWPMCSVVVKAVSRVGAIVGYSSSRRRVALSSPRDVATAASAAWRSSGRPGSEPCDFDVR